jgi:hypothetical protein
MPLAGVEPAIPATKRPQTYSVDLAATGNDKCLLQLEILFGFGVQLLKRTSFFIYFNGVQSCIRQGFPHTRTKYLQRHKNARLDKFEMEMKRPKSVLTVREFVEL